MPDELFEKEDIQTAIHEVHTTFGGVLLEKWKFSNEFIKIAELHHWNTFPKETDKKLLIISLANHLANDIGFNFFNTEDNTDKKLNAPAPEINELLKELSIEDDQLTK